MPINWRKCLIILATSIVLLTLPGCSGESSPTSEGQDASEVPTESQSLPTATRTEIPPAAEPTEPPASEWSDTITWAASDPDDVSGLELQSVGDSDTEAILAGDPQEPAHRVGGGEVLPSDDGNEIEDHFMQFNIDDAFLHGGVPTQSVQIEVEYLDEGTGTFFIEYDGENDQGPLGDGRFTGTAVITKTDSGEFRTATFWVNDAYFANRDKGGDFRISDSFDGGGEIIRRVTVMRIMPGSELASALLVNFHDDGNQLAPRQCTTLHWAVENATGVTLNGNPVDPQGHDYECPESTTVYTLVAWNDFEEKQEEITINVTQPPAAEDSGLDIAAVCGPTSNGFYFGVYIHGVGYDGQQTGPITLDAYTGYEKDLDFTFSWQIPSLIFGQKMSEHQGLPSDTDCCRAVLRGNNDVYPGNDTDTWCVHW